MGDTESIAEIMENLSGSFTRESYYASVLGWTYSKEFAEESTQIAYGENGLLNPNITEDQFVELIGQMGMDQSHAYSTKDILDLLSGNILISPEIRKEYESLLDMYYMTILNYFLGCRDLEREEGGLIYALRLQEGYETPIKDYWAGCGYDVDDAGTCDPATREDIIEIQRFVYTFLIEEDEAAWREALEKPWPTEGNGGEYSEDDVAAQERRKRMETRIKLIGQKLDSEPLKCTGPESVPPNLGLRPDDDDWSGQRLDVEDEKSEPDQAVKPVAGKLATTDERRQVVMDTDRCQNIEKILEARSELRKPLNKVANEQAIAIAQKHGDPGISLGEDQERLIDVNIKMTKVLEHSGVAQLMEDFQSKFFSSHGDEQSSELDPAIEVRDEPVGDKPGELDPALEVGEEVGDKQGLLDRALEVGEGGGVVIEATSKHTGPGGTISSKNGGGAKSRRKTKKKSRRKTKKKTRKTRRKSRNKIRKKYKNRKTQKGVYSRIKLSGGAQRRCGACERGHCLKHRRGLPAQPAANARRDGNTGCLFLSVILQTVGRIAGWICRGVLGLLGWIISGARSLVSWARGRETGGDVNLDGSVEVHGSVEVEPPSPAPAPEPEKRDILSEPINIRRRPHPPIKDKSLKLTLDLETQLPHQWLLPEPPGSTVILDEYRASAEELQAYYRTDGASLMVPEKHVRYIYDDDPEKLAYWETLLNVTYHDHPQGDCVFPKRIPDPDGRRRGRGIKVLGVEMIENAPQWRQFQERQAKLLEDVQQYKESKQAYDQGGSHHPPSPEVFQRMRNDAGKSVEVRVTVDFETIPEIAAEVNRRRQIFDSQYLTSCLSTKSADPGFMTTDDINSINMVDVWHGCDPLNIASIKYDGFSTKHARDTGLYGPGAYFAPQACKALQYCEHIGNTGIPGCASDAHTRVREKNCPLAVLDQREKWIDHCRERTHLYKVGDAVLYRRGRSGKYQSARIHNVGVEGPTHDKTYIYFIKFTAWQKTKTFLSQTPGQTGSVRAHHGELWPDIRIYCITHSSVIMGATIPTAEGLSGLGARGSIIEPHQCLTAKTRDKSRKNLTYNSIMAIGGATTGGGGNRQVHHEFVSMLPEKFTYVSHVIWFTIN